jgi:glycosyltransferase involved in cell wall biosynthesis
MRILLLASELPYPPTDSNRAVTYHLLRHLVRSGRDVTLLAFGGGDAPGDVAVIRDLVGRLVLVEHVVPKTVCRRLASMFSVWPFGVLLCRDRAFSAAVAAALRENTFDIILGGNINMAQYTVGVTTTPKIIAPLDAVSLYYRRQLERAGNPAAFLYSFMQYFKVRRYERRTYSRYDACVLVARRDAEVIRDLCPGLPIYFAPSGTDIPPLKEERRTPGAVAFSGVMDYPPNVDAAVYFAEKVFPLVRRAVPTATFHVVGKNPAPEVRDLEALDGVIVTGTVPDVRDYLRRMEVYVCPMRLGAGMKMKVVEALAVALPVVSTTRGAEGMDLVEGRDIFVVDEPEPFAGIVTRLLGDEALRREYGQWGRQAVERAYTWEANARAWDEIIASVAAGRKY